VFWIDRPVRIESIEGEAAIITSEPMVPDLLPSS
jgi:hypothetical protein